MPLSPHAEIGWWPKRNERNSGAPISREAFHGIARVAVPLVARTHRSVSGTYSARQMRSEMPLAPLSSTAAEVRGPVASVAQVPASIFRSAESTINPANWPQAGPAIADPGLGRVAQPGTRRESGKGRAVGGTNPEELAETVIRLTMDRLTIEAERRGWPQWT
jgi:hypothetical protein